MKLFSSISFLILILISSALGHGAGQDSSWNLKDLDYEEYRKRKAQAFEKARGFEESHGWFPKSTIGMIQIGFIPMYGGDNFDVADNVRSKSFVPTTNPFSGDIFLKSEEREIVKPNSQEIHKSEFFLPIIGKLFETADYPKTIHGGFGFDFLYSPDLPVNIYGKLVATINSGLLFSRENQKSYLNYEGKPKQFTEACIVHLTEWSINTGLAFELPIYGAFINAQNSLVNSYYYMSFGPSIDYIIWSDATQFLQIADAKKELRYDNGQNTLDLQSGVVLKGLNRLRYGIDIAAGWKFGGGRTGIGMEIFAYIPLNSVLDDAVWKQYRFGFRYKLMYSGLSGK